MTGFFTATESDACDRCGSLIRKGDRIYCEDSQDWPHDCERRVCGVCAP